MTNKTLHKISGTIFAFIAIAHFARVLFLWEILFETVSIPMWVSGVGTAFFGMLAIILFWKSRKE
ncbi:MAG: hypothetical protein AAB362_01810 [Patescibacteria group bacterium]